MQEYIAQKTKVKRRFSISGKTAVWLKIAGVAIVFVSVVFCFIWQTIQYNQLKTRRIQLSAAIEEAEDDRAQLITEVAQLSAPENVIAVARDELGMEPLRPDQIVILDSGTLNFTSTNQQDR